MSAPEHAYTEGDVSKYWQQFQKQKPPEPLHLNKADLANLGHAPPTVPGYCVHCVNTPLILQDSPTDARPHAREYECPHGCLDPLGRDDQDRTINCAIRMYHVTKVPGRLMKYGFYVCTWHQLCKYIDVGSLKRNHPNAWAVRAGDTGKELLEEKKSFRKFNKSNAKQRNNASNATSDNQR